MVQPHGKDGWGERATEGQPRGDNWCPVTSFTLKIVMGKKKKVYHLFHLSMFTERLESCLPIELYFLSVSGAERGTAYYCRSRTFLKEKQEATPGGPHFTGQCDRAGPWRRSDLAVLPDKSWARGHPQSWREEPSFPIGH